MNSRMTGAPLHRVVYSRDFRGLHGMRCLGLGRHH
jgi:hypothetical protein